MRVLVTGGTGFIGSHLIERLLREGHEVWALVRSPQKLARLGRGDGLYVLRGDLFNLPSLPRDIEIVFHSAGLTKASRAKEYYTVNQKGTASLFQGLKRDGLRPRVVLFSSQAAGGPSLPSGKPRREEDAPAPVSPYGKSKLRAEEEGIRFRNEFQVAVLRPGPVYGPRDEDFLEYFRWIRKGWLPRFGRAETPLSAVFVGDLIEAALLAARPGLPSGEIFNIAAEPPVTWEEIGNTTALILGCGIRKLAIPLGITYLACAASEVVARISRKPTAVNLSKYADLKAGGWIMDIRKARLILGFQAARTLEDGLKETLAWYRANGLL